jgi:hypothetical protein
MSHVACAATVLAGNTNSERCWINTTPPHLTLRSRAGEYEAMVSPAHAGASWFVISGEARETWTGPSVRSAGHDVCPDCSSAWVYRST